MGEPNCKSPTLPVGPVEHVSMDYARLREEGLRLLASLGGAQWSDHNAHDPGVTILEQLCYGITDLAYRIAFPVPELLGGAASGLPRPHAILTCDPVTWDDLRKLALDVDGIGNAWVEEPDQPELPFYYHAGSAELRLRADPCDPDAVPVQLRGLERLVLHTTGTVPSELAIANVAARLHAGRALGSDFALTRMASFEVGMRAVIEVGALDDPTSLLTDIITRIEEYLAPSARFLTLAEARARGRALDEVLEGPLLAHGFVDLLPEPRRTVCVSDLLHVILDAPGVKAVRSLLLQGSADALETWTLTIPAGHGATLSPAAELTLVRDGLPLTIDANALRRQLEARRLLRAPTRSATSDAGADDATGLRRRDLGRYRSLQYQLPAIYGVGPLGLPSSACPHRQAQARQLEAYLLIFDQLLANGCAQLAQACNLLAADDAEPRTYFAQPVEDARLRLASLLRQDSETHRAWLESVVEPGDPLERRQRFLVHLLARFGEQLGEHSLIKSAGEPSTPRDGKALIDDRRAFLRAYARLSGARGSGYDVTRYGEPEAGSGFEERLQHKLGLRDAGRLYVVEHVLLRPVPEDLAQLAEEGEPEVPLLAGVDAPDPWSLRVSVVMREPDVADPSFDSFVTQTVATEIPAHLSASIVWLGDSDGIDHWSAFAAAWDRFRAAYRDYRGANLQDWTANVGRQLRCRDARDQVIDLLGFGRTYPLRDLPLPERVAVPAGSRARIALGFSQADVSYELRYAQNGRQVQDGNTPVTVAGTGGAIELVTPPIDEDESFRILAVKREDAHVPELRREAWLRAVVSVVEGVDPTLVAQIRNLPLLDAGIDNPKPSDARIGNWGAVAEVEVLASQEGVTYELIEDAADLSDVTRHHVVSESAVIGTSGTIALRTVVMSEDIDLRVRASKDVGTPGRPLVRTAVLDLVLPLRVRANPGLSAEALPAVSAYGGDQAVVRLGATQASAEYRVFVARARDLDFVFAEPPSSPTIDVMGDGRTVRIKRPPATPIWQDLEGFAPASSAARGDGGALDLPLGSPITADLVLLVQATKRHRVGPLANAGAEILSMVQLDRALAVLARPNSDAALSLAVSMSGSKTTGSVRVAGGEPGVFYELRVVGGDEEPLGRPAYFHQRDDAGAQLNKGVGQLRVEIDLVVPRDQPLRGASTASTPPALPTLETKPLPAATVLAFTARRAMTGLGAQLRHHAVVDDVPAVAAVPATVPRGSAAKIVIDASRPDERYRLTAAGEVIGGELTGTGNRVELDTGPLERRTSFTVVLTRSRPDSLTVERHVEISVDVEPDV